MKNWEGKTRGASVKVGDMLEVLGRQVRIVRIWPYTGAVADLFPAGARIAAFDIGGGMTLDNEWWYQSVDPAELSGKVVPATVQPVRLPRTAEQAETLPDEAREDDLQEGAEEGVEGGNHERRTESVQARSVLRSPSLLA